MNKNEPLIVMLCTQAKGGMRTVVENYQRDGLFDRWNIKLIITHDDGSVAKRMWIFLRAYLYFLYVITFNKVHLIHNHSSVRGSFWRKNFFSMIARLKKIPLILHLHGDEIEEFYGSKPPWLQKKITQILTKPNILFVLSESWKKRVLKIAPDAKIKVVPNYISLPEITTVEPLTEDVTKLLFLGKVGIRKGAYDLVDAIEILANKNIKLELSIGGDGEVEKLQEILEQKGLTHQVKLLGWVGLEEKDQLLRRSDIFLLPSYNEGLPMSVLEAMAYAKAVISTPVGGIGELLNNEVDGLMVEPGDVQALSDAIADLCANPEKRRQLGKAARSTIEQQYSDKTVLPIIEAKYAEFCAKKI